MGTLALSKPSWAGLWATLFLAVCRGLAAGEPWRAVEQPELKQALEQAPALQTESLGEPARGVNTWEHWAVPNPDGKTWDELQVYFREYYEPTWVFSLVPRPSFLFPVLERDRT